MRTAVVDRRSVAQHLVAVRPDVRDLILRFTHIRRSLRHDGEVGFRRQRGQVALCGEVDAGYIWNRTATKQLVEVQGFSQSEHDPGYFWKKLNDGTRMDLLL